MCLMVGRVLWVLLFWAMFIGGQLWPPAAWEAADRATIHLSPDAFPELPSAIRRELYRRGCTVPQSQFGASKTKEVVRGTFHSINEVDWAVLCSVNRRSSVLVFCGGNTHRVEAIAPAQPDSGYLQASSQSIVFSRVHSGGVRDRALAPCTRERGPSVAPAADSRFN
jgi:hypothetical protein